MFTTVNNKKELITAVTQLGYTVTGYEYCMFTQCITLETNKGNFYGNTRKDLLKTVIKRTAPRDIIEAVEFLAMFVDEAHPAFSTASDEMFYNDKSVHQILKMFK